MAARLLLLLTALIVVDELCVATLSKSDKKKKKSTQETKEFPKSSVVERDLVTENIKWKDVVSNYKYYSKDLSTKSNFNAGPVLAYVTPWNNHGYDTAKWFAAKFTHISPVWLQLVLRQGNVVGIQGEHDIDQGWIKEVRAGNKKVKIVPRLLFEGWSANSFVTLFRNPEHVKSIGQTIVSFLTQHKFDGIVLEIWSQLGGHYKLEVTDAVIEWSSMLHSKNMELILVIPSQLRGSLFDSSDFEALVYHVDGFSIMTYDYTDPHKPGPVPVAPLSWVRDCVVSLVPEKSEKRQKILLGLNFYGYSYGSSSVQPVVGSTFIELLSKHKPNLQWDAEASEHYIQYRSGSIDYVVYFPTLKSLESKIQLAQELGTGLSIWEIGQGLDYFYDLF